MFLKRIKARLFKPVHIDFIIHWWILGIVITLETHVWWMFYRPIADKIIYKIIYKFGMISSTNYKINNYFPEYFYLLIDYLLKNVSAEYIAVFQCVK